MCGVIGIWNLKGVNKDHFTSNLKSLYHRGPDHSAAWFSQDDAVALGHTRLSIVDLESTGNQPMISHGKRYVISFNGEIYNFKEIKKELLKTDPNLHFKSSGDTEVILALFELFGVHEGIKRLRGMFAIAVWDQKNKTLNLAIDRAGEKPLYYGIINSILYFSSELKAIKKMVDNLSVSSQGINIFLAQGNIPAPLTIYNNFYKACPAEIITFQNAEKLQSDYYWLLDNESNYGYRHSFEDASKRFEELFLNSVQEQMISDVSLGAFLSGGIDSSAVVAAMSELSSKKIETHTIGYSEQNFDERVNARQIAAHLSTNHHEYEFSSNDALSIIPNLGSIYCEPFADSSQIPTYFLCKMTKKNVTVALSGDGGDELFGGYNRYILFKKFEGAINYFPASLRVTIAKLIVRLSQSNFPYILIDRAASKLMNLRFSRDKLEKIARAVSQKDIESMFYSLLQQWNDTNWPLEEGQTVRVDSIYKSLNFQTINSYMDMRLHDFKNYLPNDILVKVDRASMSHSLETRVPFLDYRMIEFAMSLPGNLLIDGNRGKLLIRSFLNKRVPQNILGLPKSGFGVPINTWLQGPLNDWAETTLFENCSNDNLFDYSILRRKWSEHLQNKHDWSQHLWSILMLKSWAETNDISLER